MLKLEKLNSETFEDIVESAVKEIARHDTSWNNLQAADPGMTLVDLLAWLKAMQHQYMSVIFPESKRRFLELLGMESRPVQCARTLVEVSGAETDFRIPEESKWRAGELVFENRTPAAALASRLKSVVFRSGERAEQVEAGQLGQGRLFPVFPGLGAEPVREPREEMRLFFTDPIPSGWVFSLYVSLQEDPRRTPVREGDDFVPLARLSWEVYARDGWKEAEVVRDDTHGFLFSGLLSLRYEGEMAPLEDQGFAVRVRLLQDGYDFPPQVRDIRFNVVEVFQQDTLVRQDVFQGPAVMESHLGLFGRHRVFVKGEEGWQETGFSLEEQDGKQVILPQRESGGETMVISYGLDEPQGVTLGSGTGFSHQRLEFPLVKKGILDLNLLIGRGRGEKTTFTQWEKREDFYSSGPRDRHFVMDAEEGILQFGDHVQGVMPPKGEGNILLGQCRVSRGKEGNIKAGQIRKLDALSPALAALTVRQILPASGGEDGEKLEETLARAEEALRSGERAVTAADYQALLCKIPGLIVENSRVLTGFAGPEDRRITLVVQGAGRAREQALPSYEENIRRVMDRHRLLTTQIHVVWPRRVELVVRGRLAAAPYGQDAPGQVRRRTEQFVRDLNQNFGSVFSFGELYCAVDLLDCVERIESLSVEPVGEYIQKTTADDILAPPNSIYHITRFELSFTGSL